MQALRSCLAAGNARLQSGLAALIVELVVVGGTMVAYAVNPGGKPLDALAYLLLIVAGGAVGAVGFGRVWPLGASACALAATTIYFLAGYSGSSTIFLGLLAALYAAVDPDAPSRTVALGAVTIVTLVARNVVAAGPDGLNVGTVAAAGWVVATLTLSHAIAGHRASVAATVERARRAEETREIEADRRVAEERLRIAREVHDVLAHTISVINVQAGVALYLVNDQPAQARQALATIRASSKEALAELRGLLGLLRAGEGAAPRVPAPSLAQLDGLLENADRAGVRAEVRVHGEARSLPTGVDLAAYRIVQESLTNVVRHAGSGVATITIAYEPGRVLVEVVDDGRGGGESADGSGNGLIGMRERALALGGEFVAGPRPEGGFRVRACLPTGMDV